MTTVFDYMVFSYSIQLLEVFLFCELQAQGMNSK